MSINQYPLQSHFLAFFQHSHTQSASQPVNQSINQSIRRLLGPHPRQIYQTAPVNGISEGTSQSIDASDGYYIDWLRVIGRRSKI